MDKALSPAPGVGGEEAFIHKEYHLSTAEPMVVSVENSKPVCSTNYIVADLLADIGMEAIHPKKSRTLSNPSMKVP